MVRAASNIPVQRVLRHSRHLSRIFSLMNEDGVFPSSGLLAAGGQGETDLRIFRDEYYWRDLGRRESLEQLQVTYEAQVTQIRLRTRIADVMRVFKIPFDPFLKFTLSATRVGIVEPTGVLGSKPAVSEPDQCRDKISNPLIRDKAETAADAVMRDRWQPAY